MNENELRAVIARNGETAKRLAEYLDMAEGTLSAKIRGTQDFWLHEIKQIKEHYNLTNDELDAIFFAEKESEKCTEGAKSGQ